MKRAKKLLVLLLVAAMALAGMPLGAFADVSAKLTGQYYNVDTSGSIDGAGTTEASQTITDTGSDAYVKLSKTATETGVNEFRITLNVETMEDLEEIEIPTGANVVLVLNISNVMDCSIDSDGNLIPYGLPGWELEKTCWSLLKEAAKEFITAFLTESSNNRVSIVAYGGQEYNIPTVGGITSKPYYPGADGINGNRIVHITLCDWTNDASEAIDSFYNYPVMNRLIASYLGFPNSSSLQYDIFGIGSNEYGGTVNCQAGFQAALEQLNKIYNGTDSNYTQYSESSPYVVYTSPSNAGDSYDLQGGTGAAQDVAQANADAIATAINLKNTIDNCTIYTIGIGSATIGCSTLTNEDYVEEFFYVENMSDLSTAFNSIYESAQTSSEAWTVTDPMPSYVTLNPSSISGRTDCSFSSGVLTWDLTKCTPAETTVGSNTVYTYTLSYTITVDPAALSEGTVYPTNKQTTLSYAFAEEGGELGEEQTAYFRVPGVKLAGETYNVKYAFESGTDGKTLPSEIMAFLPANTSGHADEANVTPANPGQTTYEVTDGTWSFTGWSPGSATINGADVTFTGTWVFRTGFDPTETYTVTYNANGGTGSYADANLASGSLYTVKTLYATSIYRSGYTFLGWNTEADGSGTSYTAGNTMNITGNVTLYAQWRLGEVSPTIPPTSPVSTLPPVALPQTGSNDTLTLAALLILLSAAMALALVPHRKWKKQSEK